MSGKSDQSKKSARSSKNKSMTPAEYQKALTEIKELEYLLEMKNGLPHLFGFPWYKWAKDFFDSRDKAAFIVAANQISKSSTQIRKAIDWATDPKKWPDLWPGLLPGQKPNQFWYFYPTFEVWQTEFETKWEPDFLPRGKFKDDPNLGWKEYYDKGQIKKIEFNSGVTIYCKAYSQKIKDLQSGSVHALFCFVAGTKLITPFGSRNIEDIKIGDYVLGQYGFNKVLKTMNRQTPVIEVTFSNGQILRGSKDHPIWTKNGWVSLGRLTDKDICQTVDLCNYVPLMLSYFVASFIRGTQSIKTHVKETIGYLDQEFPDIFMWKYGKLIINKAYQKIASFIILISTRLITLLKICSFSQGLSTQEFINWKNGNLKKKKNLIVQSVAMNSSVDLLRKLYQDIVQKNVEVLRKTAVHLLKNVNAVIKNLASGKTILQDVTVVKLVQIDPLEKESIFNIKVDSDSTYLANNILVHNCDEEAPVEFIPELQARLRATDGYINAVFTATLGQDFWRRVMEPKNAEEEIYPGAFKRTVSMYDAQEYIDGTPSRWTNQRIKKIIAECATDAEVQRRVFGRFVKSEGLKIESFDLDRNMTPARVLPQSWGNFSGVDPGSGGKSGHPAAMIFMSVRPDYRYAEVFRAWRGDGIPTANTDILRKYRELKGSLLMMGQVYDYKDKDFYLVAQGQGESFQMANKARDEGFGLLNSLFKNGMLKIQRGDPELDKLVSEILSLSSTTDKRKAVDDLLDSLRYSCLAIPWDFSHVGEDDANAATKFNDAPPDLRSEDQIRNELMAKDRRAFALNLKRDVDSNDDEFNYWNELSGANDD